MSYPVVAECWNIFEACILVQARKLVDDIAKHQGTESKELWAKVRPTIKIPLIEFDIPEQPLCTLSLQKEGSRILEKCNAPCLIGFERCQTHMQSVGTVGDYSRVDRIADEDGISYFIDAQSVVRDSAGIPKGLMEDGVVFLFEKK
jgi:hypothetical protein